MEEIDNQKYSDLEQEDVDVNQNQGGSRHGAHGLGEHEGFVIPPANEDGGGGQNGAPQGGRRSPPVPDAGGRNLGYDVGEHRRMAKAYSARFSILGGIGIFGGGATFGPIFNSDKRSFYDIIAISSICFTLATVLAVAGGLVAGVKPSKKVHDLNWVHGWLVFFALTSAALVFGGIVLLGVALISYKKTDAMVIGGGIHIAVAGVVLGVALSVVGRLKRWPCFGW